MGIQNAFGYLAECQRAVLFRSVHHQLLKPDETIPVFSGLHETTFEGSSASVMKPVCEGPGSTCFSGAASQYAASEVVLWLRSHRL